jgi:thiamine-monophosphate kinase
MDELELLTKIEERLRVSDVRVAIGVGDDAAVLAPMARGTVLSVDVAVEGVHFDRRWLSLEDAGYRGYVAALSDLAAMGAAPVAGLLSMIVPSAASDGDVLRMIDGAREAALLYGAPIVGGNLSSGAELAMSTTVVGAAPEHPIERRGARAGDALYVTGTLGAAALGLSLLSRDESTREHAAVFVDRWRRPRARFDRVPALLGVASSAIDVSDGLVQDLEHLAKASRVGAIVESALLPLEEGHAELAAALGLDGDLLALSGGEDYELLFTAAEGAVDASIATRIGSIVPGQGVRVLDRSGSERVLPRGGYRHR